MLGIALGLVLTISVTYGVMEVLWYREPTMLVQMMMYEAMLVGATPEGVGGVVVNPGQAGSPVNDPVEVNSWVRQPDDHHYEIAIKIDTMNQIDEGVLRINLTVPDYLSINISCVKVVETTMNLGEYDEVYGWNPFTTVATLASDVALGTEITFLKTDALWNVAQYTKHAILITLSEYQIASSEGLPSIDIDTKIELGVSTYD